MQASRFGFRPPFVSEDCRAAVARLSRNGCSLGRPSLQTPAHAPIRPSARRRSPVRGGGMTDALIPDDFTEDLPDFTYSHPGQSRFRRSVIRLVERLGGQPMLRDLYIDWAADPDPSESVFQAALRLLRIDLRLSGRDHLAAVPDRGGVVLVANHPFGIVDGLALGWLGMHLRGSVQIVTNSLLCRVPALNPHLLPIDFSGTAEARRISGCSRRAAIQRLDAGGVIAIFPGGGVATANRPLAGRAVDSDWHPFLGRLATHPGVTVLPVHFGGQNSRLFQIASHLSYPARVALIFHETRRRMGRPLEITLGAPIPAEDLRRAGRSEATARLRALTMRLDPRPADNPDETFLWPPHIRF